MRRVNTFNDVAATGRVQIDTGDSVQVDLPVSAAASAHTHPISDVTGLAARLAALEYKSGRRNITALLNPAPTSGNLYIERRGDTVWLHMDTLVLATTSDTIYSGVIPTGFQITTPAEIPAAQRSTHDAKGGLRTYGGSLGFYYLGQSPGPFRGMVSWPTNQAIPTTPPGSPA